MTILNELKAAHAAANTALPKDPELARASNKDLEGRALPLTMYEATYTYTSDSVLAAGAVRPIQVTRFGVLPGASSPSISFTDHNGRAACGAASLFYTTPEAAQAEVDYCMACKAKKEAEYLLIALMKNNLPALIECVEVLQDVVDSGALDALDALEDWAKRSLSKLGEQR